MAKRILNKTNCQFSCSFLAGTIQIQQLKPAFNDGGANALTAEACLSGNGICSVLTSATSGVPQQCTLKMSKAWISGIERTKTINSVPLLNQDAEIHCPAGGIIKANVFPAPLIIPVPAVTAGSAQSGKETQNLKAEVLSHPQENPEKQQASGQKSEVQDFPNQKLSEPDYKNSACPSCKKADVCPYQLTPDTISTEGAAAKLRRNSPKKEAAYDTRYGSLTEQYQASWGNQAHHMISIKAAYCQYPALVKLGNYFGYDINCEENCYFLPAWKKGDGYGEKTSHFKKAQAYEVMRISGLQWHVGQHDYPVVIPENLLQKYPYLKEMVCYNTKVNQDVKKILAACMEKFEGKCLEEHYEEYQCWFLRQMNRLSAQIEEHLDLFQTYPKESYPYYVSMEAFRFAYEIPRSGKVISVHQTSEKWTLRKYRYSNYIKDDKFQLDFLETKILAIAENHRNSTIKQLVIFCENVSCFLLISGAGTFQLPFSFRVRTCLIKENDNIKSHFSAMLAESIDENENQYIAPKAMIYNRLKECGL